MTTNLNNCNVEMQSLTFVHTTLCQLYSVVVHPPNTYRCQIVSPRARNPRFANPARCVRVFVRPCNENLVY